jgi:hypothetical protein
MIHAFEYSLFSPGVYNIGIARVSVHFINSEVRDERLWSPPISATIRTYI